MSEVRGVLETTILLNKNTCYYMKNGRCSLDLIDNFALLPAVKSAPSDVLYCPRLYRAMKSRKKDVRTIKVIPCECGHAEVVSGQQKACIASQKGFQLRVEMNQEKCEDLCAVCGRQMTFDEETAMSQGGARIMSIRAIIENDDEEENT